MKVVKVIDARVPKAFLEAIKILVWAASIDKDPTKFDVNNCLHVVPNEGQHKVPMMCLFNIQTDETQGSPCSTGRPDDTP